jgi:hypothetical protein
MLSKCLSEPFINTSCGVGLHVWNKRGIGSQRDANAGMPSPFADDFDMHAIHQLMRDVSVA